MATIGIKHPVYAVISAMNANAKPTYNASKSGILGKATKADVTLNFAEGSLYADDALAEYATKFQNGTISAGFDELTPQKYADLLGYRIDSTGGTSILRKGAKDSAPHVGFGYYKTKMIDGVKKYQAKVFYNCVFKESGDNAETATDSINFQTVELAATILPVIGFNEDDYTEEQIFTSESAAVTYLHSALGITGTPSTRSAPAETTDGGTKGK
ncbi:MAG: hypothetical protein J5864_08110 [Oscillospiraceae bacterium]|nr:hypothetical protein [Oscillospiraceae bacterium]